MSDINRIFFTAKEALLSNLTAMNATGANIANVNTPGYSRLRTIFESQGSTGTSTTQVQTGVKIAEVQRVYDKFVVEQLIAQQAQLGEAGIKKDLLTRTESVLNESGGGGINEALSQFWSAWSDLSANPSGETQRNALVNAADNLTSMFRQRADNLTTIQTDANQNITDTVSTLNGYLKDMAALNDQIVKSEMNGGQANDLRDKRDTLLNEINGIVNINYMEKSDGALYVYMASNGNILVDGNNAKQLTVRVNPGNSNFYDIAFTDSPNQPINNYINSGKLAGLLAFRDVTITSYIDELNQTASSIINKVNAQQMSGYDQYGNIGGMFFNQTKEAKNMQVSAAIFADNGRIAASATVNADGDNATAMAAIKDENMYASLGRITTSTIAAASATGTINNIGQSYKNTLNLQPILLRHGATSAASDWTIVSNGGYTSLNVLSADDKTVTLDLNGNGMADITLSLSGTWQATDTISFALSKSDATTIDGYYNNFIAKVGQDVTSSSSSFDRETTINNQLSDQREQLSGVSLDEEMMNLIKYQMAYNAAGRLTTTVSDLMDLLINLGKA
jgi:flagellar hook-associated protein 1